MKTDKFDVEGMSCAACSAHVEKAVSKVNGVKNVSVSLLSNSMLVDYNVPATEDAICKAVRKAGYTASIATKGISSSIDNKVKENNSINNVHNEVKIIRRRLIFSICLLLPLMYVTMGVLMWNCYLPSSFKNNPIAIGLYELILTTIVIIINKKFFISGFQSLFHGGPNMDTLISLGSGTAFLYSIAILFIMSGDIVKGDIIAGYQSLHNLYFESTAMILTLITVGKLLEAHSKGKATDAINSLIKITPKTAHVIRQDKEIIVPAEEVSAGDIFTVRPGESFPADGTVIEGYSTADESVLTGESLPIEKTKDSKISAGTINQNGFLKCSAIHTGKDTMLSHIIEMVENVAATKAPAAKAADKVSGIFVPIVIGIAIITAIIWLTVGKDFGYALTRAVSVLVISCPCALGLATPVSIMVGSGLGARNGILFKTAAALEATGKSNIVVLDKTGTVTEGKPQVTDIYTSTEISNNELLHFAASLEVNSEHPLAQAIIEKSHLDNIILSTANNFTALPGHGVHGFIDGKEVWGGNMSLMEEKGIMTEDMEIQANKLSAEGKTPIFFSIDSIIAGIIAVADVVKVNSFKAVEELKKLRIRVVMLTGDNNRTAKVIGSQVGIEEIVSDVLPDDKAQVINALIKEGKVAMVGDGINDAPALTCANTGIAIGSGTDVAIDAADVVLTSSDLIDVPSAIRLSRQVLHNIYENLFWAFFYNIICIPLAAGAFTSLHIEISPMFAAAAMSLSSFCVVSNALRLNMLKIHSSNKAIKNNNNPNNKTMNMKKMIFIEGMMCDHCRMHIEKALSSITGVTDVVVSLEKKNAIVTMSSEVSDETLSSAVTEAGYAFVKCEKIDK